MRTPHTSRRKQQGYAGCSNLQLLSGVSVIGALSATAALSAAALFKHAGRALTSVGQDLTTANPMIGALLATAGDVAQSPVGLVTLTSVTFIAAGRYFSSNAAVRHTDAVVELFDPYAPRRLVSETKRLLGLAV